MRVQAYVSHVGETELALVLQETGQLDEVKLTQGKKKAHQACVGFSLLAV